MLSPFHRNESREYTFTLYDEQKAGLRNKQGKLKKLPSGHFTARGRHTQGQRPQRD